MSQSARPTGPQANRQRRSIAFQNAAEVVDDARQLAASGYTQLGNWNLAQICLHLEAWMRYPLDGYPPLPWYLKLPSVVMRKFLAPGILRKAIRTRALPAGSPTLPQTTHAAHEATDAEAIDRLERTARRFDAHVGPFQPSPLFGSVGEANGRLLQLVHCAHHLSFLVPAEAASEQA